LKTDFLTVYFSDIWNQENVFLGRDVWDLLCEVGYVFEEKNEGEAKKECCPKTNISIIFSLLPSIFVED